MDARIGERLATGRTAEVFAWGEGRVLKLSRPWCPPEWAPHEAGIVEAVSSQGMPVPRAIELVEVDGRGGIVYERVDGRSLLATSLSRPWRLRSLARQFAEIHAQMHGLDGEGLAPLRPSVARSIRGAQALPEELQRKVLRLLGRLPEGGALCHLDYHPDQVIMSAKGPVVIDWPTARKGEPLADVARTLVVLRIGQVADARLLLRAAAALWRRRFRRVYLARYRALRPGVGRGQLRSWVAVMAAARLEERIEGEEGRLLALVRASLDGERGASEGGASP